MKTIAALIVKDLRRKVRSPVSSIILLVFPVFFALLIGLAFGGGGREEKLPPVEILLVDEDASLAGNFIRGAASQPQLSDRFTIRPVKREEGMRLISQGKAAALLLVRAGFTAHLLASEPDTLFLWRNPGESVMPLIAQEFVEAVGTGLSSAAVVLAEPLGKIKSFMDAQGPPPDEAVASVAVDMNRTFQEIGRYVNPPLIGLEAGGATAAADSSGPGGASSASPGSVAIALLVLPGMAAFSLLLIALSNMRDILREDATGTLRRLLTAPVSVPQVIASKIIASAAMAVLTLLILSAISAVWGASRVDLAGYVLLSLAFVLAVCGFAALVYGLARNEHQGSTVGEIIVMIMAFLGGSWVPLSSLPDSVRRISPFTLNYWAIEGFQRLMNNGAGAAQLGTNLAVLGVSGVLMLVVGSEALRRRLLRGA